MNWWEDTIQTNLQGGGSRKLKKCLWCYNAITPHHHDCNVDKILYYLCMNAIIFCTCLQSMANKLWKQVILHAWKYTSTFPLNIKACCYFNMTSICNHRACTWSGEKSIDVYWVPTTEEQWWEPFLPIAEEVTFALTMAIPLWYHAFVCSVEMIKSNLDEFLCTTKWSCHFPLYFGRYTYSIRPRQLEELAYVST